MHLRAFRPDVIVVTELCPAVLLAPIKAQGAVRTPVVVVFADYGVHALWVQPGIDHYCVATSAMRAALIGAGTESERISLTGIPLMPGFRHLPSRYAAKAALGFDPKRPVVLIPGGVLGLGLKQAAEALVGSGLDAQWLVVAGRNEAACERLCVLATVFSSLRVHGWIEHIKRMLRAAVAVVGKPGGLTVAEAMACGCLLLAAHCLHGQEGFSVRFLEAHAVGRLVRGQDLVATLAVWLADRRKLAAMQARAWALGKRDSAQQVVDIACDLWRQRASSRPPSGNTGNVRRTACDISPAASCAE